MCKCERRLLPSSSRPQHTLRADRRYVLRKTIALSTVNNAEEIHLRIALRASAPLRPNIDNDKFSHPCATVARLCKPVHELRHGRLWWMTTLAKFSFPTSIQGIKTRLADYSHFFLTQFAIFIALRTYREWQITSSDFRVFDVCSFPERRWQTWMYNLIQLGWRLDVTSHLITRQMLRFHARCEFICAFKENQILTIFHSFSASSRILS